MVPSRSNRERDQLILQHRPLAQKIAHRLQKRCCVPYDEIESSAFLGLIKAVDRFDPSSGNKFSSYAVPCIRGEILRYLRDSSPVPRKFQDLYLRGQKIEGSDETIAAELNLTTRQWQIVCELSRYHFSRQVDSQLHELLSEFQNHNQPTQRKGCNQAQAQAHSDILKLLCYNYRISKEELGQITGWGKDAISKATIGWRYRISPNNAKPCPRCQYRLQRRAANYYCFRCKKRIHRNNLDMY